MWLKKRPGNVGAASDKEKYICPQMQLSVLQLFSSVKFPTMMTKAFDIFHVKKLADIAEKSRSTVKRFLDVGDYKRACELVSYFELQDEYQIVRGFC